MCCWSTRAGRESQSKTGGIPVSCLGRRPSPSPIQSQDFHRLFEQNSFRLCVCMSVYVFKDPLCYLHTRCTQKDIFFFSCHSPSFSSDIVVTSLLYLLKCYPPPCLLSFFCPHSHPSLHLKPRSEYKTKLPERYKRHLVTDWCACVKTSWQRDNTTRDCNCN